MKIYTISDVHGRDEWKDVIGKESNFDKIVFLGDYVDSYDKKNYEILDNFIEIVDFKKQYPNKVILLFGNHDLAYYYDERCSGYRGDMHTDINEILRKNIDLFQIAFQVDNVIFSHSGIHKGWWKYYALPIIEGKIEKRYTPYFILCNNIADQLNLMQEFNEPILRMVGHDRGGTDKIGGPIWVDKNTLYGKSLPNYHQVVGHSQVKLITTYNFGEGTKITFTDCQNEDFYTLYI